MKSKFHLLKTLFKEFIREVSLIDNPSNFNFKNYNLYKLAIEENEHSKDEILNEIKVLTDEINADVSSLVTNTIQVAKQLQESGDFKGAQKLLETSINSIKNITS